MRDIHKFPWLIDLVALSLLFTFFYFLWLGHYPLFIPDEGRYPEVAREMLVSHDFVTPRVNGVVFLDKPILYYWLEALSMELFGVSEWAIRFFPAVFGILGCLITYTTGHLLFNRKTALLSSFILATSPLYFVNAHYADLNLEVAILISATLFSFMLMQKVKNIFYPQLVMVIFAALAFLTKGLIGIALPGLVILVYLVITQNLSSIKTFYLKTGFILFTLITLPWYLLVSQKNPQFLEYFFVNQQFSRFLSHGEFNSKTPFWFYLPVIVAGFLPWCFYLFNAIKLSFKKEKINIELFLVLSIIIITLFFSIPHSKTIGYILPIFPSLALLVGRYLAMSQVSLKLFFLLLLVNIFLLLTLVYEAPKLNKNTTKPLIPLLTHLTPQDEVINYYQFYQDLPLYLKRQLTLVYDWDSPNIIKRDNWVRELWWGMSYQDTKATLIKQEIFWQRWQSQKRLYVFLPKKKLIDFHHAKYFFLGNYHDIYLITNLPL